MLPAHVTDGCVHGNVPGPRRTDSVFVNVRARLSGGRGARGSRRGLGTAACRPLWLMFWGTVGPGCPLPVLSPCLAPWEITAEPAPTPHPMCDLRQANTGPHGTET